MSVYPRKRQDGSVRWLYDFVIDGRRFHGSTGQTTRKGAEAYEARRRREIAEGKDERAEITLDLAAGRWFRDVGQHNRTADDIKRRIKTVLRLLGKDTPIEDIKSAHVLDAIQRRRDENVVNAAAEISASKRAKRGAVVATKKVSASTVNRDIIDTLRPILRHAEEVYELSLPRIPWRKLRLKEPPPIVQEFSNAQIKAWSDQLGDVERIFLAIALTYGPRLGELFFPPSALKLDDPNNPILELGRYKGRDVRESRKDGSLHNVPLLPDHARVLAVLASRATAAKLDVIWFDEDEEGRLHEISYWGMTSRLRGAAKRAGLGDIRRLLHGMRHHAGTQLLRRTNNLIVAQRTLGHRQIATTQRYAHANDADVRAGLEAVSRLHPDAVRANALLTAKKQDDEDSAPPDPQSGALTN